MKRYPPRRKARHIRVPAFVPVPVRARADGWTPGRQLRFLVALASVRSVAEAARRVGMSRETAYRLRRHPEAVSFAAAWDAVAGRRVAAKPKVTGTERLKGALGGLVKPHVWRGEYVGFDKKADDSALLAHLRSVDRLLRDYRDAGG